MMVVYIALVGAYAADKEIRRWLGKEEPPRKGAIFVYAWMLFFLIAYVINSFKGEMTLPAELAKVALQVLGIFFGSKASKKIYELKTGKGLEAMGREETILQLLKERGKITRKEIMEALKLSDSSVGSLLEEMEKKGQIRQVGDYKGAHYLSTGGK